MGGVARREVTLWPLGSSAGGERQRPPPLPVHAGEHLTGRWGWGWGLLKRVDLYGAAYSTAIVPSRQPHPPTQRPFSCRRPHGQPRLLCSHPIVVDPLIDGMRPIGSRRGSPWCDTSCSCYLSPSLPTMTHSTPLCNRGGGVAKKARTTSPLSVDVCQLACAQHVLAADALAKTVYTMGDARLAAVLSGLLTEQVAALPADAPGAGNAPIPPPEDPLSMFFATFKQPFPLSDYLARLVRYTGCSHAAYVVALVYLTRLSAAYPVLALSDYNVHRLYMTALVLAAKYVDDEVYAAAHYARVGGVPSTRELNALELHMLRLLNWNVSVDSHTYAVFEAFMMARPEALVSASPVMGPPAHVSADAVDMPADSPVTSSSSSPASSWGSWAPSSPQEPQRQA